MATKQAATRAVELLQEAVQVRKSISELYGEYHQYSTAGCYVLQGLTRHDFKRAVDALYYFGGGWPNENSKGRLEGLLDNFAGVYRVLHFIGQGHKVEEHLLKLGIKVSLDEEVRFKDVPLTAAEKSYLKTEYSVQGIEDCQSISDLISWLVMHCEGLQGQICELADEIKDELRPAVEAELQVDRPEYDRLFELTKLTGTIRGTDRAQQKKHKINTSFTGMNAATAVLAGK